MFEPRNITKSYLPPKGRRHVFRDLSLKIPAGKNIGLIGRNGAGKSTLMRLLGGADMPDSGSVATDKSISWPGGLSGGFQGSMTGRENIKFVSRVYGAVGEAMRYYKLAPEDVLVTQDALDLVGGKLRITKVRGGPGRKGLTIV